MPDIHPISPSRHAHRRWHRLTSYRFAAQDVAAPLTAAELPQAMSALPIAFMHAPEGGFVPAALQGLAPGQNLCVGADGRWNAGYIPAHYRGQPFLLAHTEDGRQVLAIDEDRAAVSEGAHGEPFFGEDGRLSPLVATVLQFLTQLAANQAKTRELCAELQRHGLIQPWPLKVQDEAQTERVIDGLFRIDEAALNALPDEAFLALRHTGALPVAYCQLLSMQQLHRLGQLAQAHEAPAQPAAPRPAEPALKFEGFLGQGESISFGGLG